jgi:hypothetical protein
MQEGTSGISLINPEYTCLNTGQTRGCGYDKKKTYPHPGLFFPIH